MGQDEKKVNSTTAFTSDRINQPEGALRARLWRAETLVESAYGASQHLNYHADCNTMKYYCIEVLGFYCPYPRYRYPLVPSGWPLLA